MDTIRTRIKDGPGSAFAALVIGPVIIVVSFVFLGYQLQRAGSELHSHVARIIERDSRWEPLLKNLNQTSINSKEFLELHLDRQDSDTAKLIEQQKEILKRQEELWALIQSKKIGELQSRGNKSMKSKKSTEMTDDWLFSQVP